MGVAVDPPLLADLLVRLLSTPSRLMRRHAGPDSQRYDLAIVTPSLEQSLGAPVVIRLPGNEGDAGIGAITTAGGAEPVVIADVEAISSLLNGYLQGE